MNSATVSLAADGTGQGSGAAVMQTQTNSSGQFALSGINSGDWHVAPQKTGDEGQAISAVDAVVALHAVIGDLQLDAEQLLACDVSGDGKVSAVDALLILQFKVGLISRFPAAVYCNSDWAFTPEPATISNQDVTAPVLAAGTCIGGAIGYHPLMGSASNQDFSAVIFGDCSGNWQPSTSASISARSAMASGNSNQISLGHVERRGRHIRIPVLVQSNKPFQGLDVDLQYDSTALTAPRVRPAGAAQKAIVAVNSTTPGHLAIALATSQPLDPGRILVLDFEVKNRFPKNGGVRIVHAAVGSY